MLFNSYIFLFAFLPVTWVAFRVGCKAKDSRLSIHILAVASLVFYSYWNPKFVCLIFASIVFNYLISSQLRPPASSLRITTKRRKLILSFGIIVNLGGILYFKYSNFFIGSIADIAGFQYSHRDIFLPLGISFFTFQQIAYLVDCYKGIVQRQVGFVHYLLFVSFFPQLIAGPIVHHSDVMPQFMSPKHRPLDYENLVWGVSMITLGLFKKVVIADTFSPWVAAAFDSNQILTLLEAWTGTLSYCLQIYFDFSGYCDMAIGIGYLFNISLPTNFNSPYKACSIVDFWRRWHITLSVFLRDYLYIPLGGNRKGKSRRYINILITMLLGGLWHGAGWTFIFWGFLHGIFICINHLWRKLSELLKIRLPKAICWVITFAAVNFAWVFFRSLSYERAVSISKSMLGLNGFVLGTNKLSESAVAFLSKLGIQVYKPDNWTIESPEQINMLVLALLICLILPNSRQWVEKLNYGKYCWAFCMAVAFFVAINFMDRISEFLYFQF